MYKQKGFIVTRAFLAITLLTVLTLSTQKSVAEEGETEVVFPDEQDLRVAIEAQTSKLREINKKIEESQQNLVKTESQKQSLEGEIGRYNYRINQIDLGIKSSEINIEKLGLEVEGLRYDIKDKEQNIALKKEAVVSFLRELQQKGNENMLFVFLKNKSLAESFTEQQSILNLNEDLAVEIESLHTLTTNLASTLDETEQKKKEEAQEAKTLSYRLSLAAEEREQKKEFLTQTKNQEKIYQEELKELEAQQSEISSEIEKIEDELRRSFDVTLLPLERPGILLWPVPLATSGGQGRITQHFGERSNLYRGKPHNGLDIGAPIGTPVIAADDGIVIGVDNNDNSWRKYQYGKYVLIEHKTNLTTLYAHLSKQVVSKGDSVKRGDIIGYVGNTGYSTGPHLHFGVYWRDSIIMKSIPPAKGLVPVGVVIDAEKYL